MESEFRNQALRIATQQSLVQECRDGVAEQDSANWVDAWREMIQKYSFDEFWGWFGSTFWNLFKGMICWCKESEVGFGAVEKRHKVVVFTDELRKLSCVFRFRDQVVDGLIGLVAMVRRVVWTLPLSWLSVLWFLSWLSMLWLLARWAVSWGAMFWRAMSWGAMFWRTMAWRTTTWRTVTRRTVM